MEENSCGVLSPAGLEAAPGLRDRDTPRSPRSRGNRVPDAEAAYRPAFLMRLPPAIRAPLLPPCSIQHHSLTHGPWCFQKSVLGPFKIGTAMFSPRGPPQLSEAPLLGWYSGTLPSSDPSWLWKRRTWEVADVPINAGRSSMSARAAEPESCASTRGNLRGGRSPHTSWLPRADLGCLPIIRLQLNSRP